MLRVDRLDANTEAQDFCAAFAQAAPQQRYLLGRNGYAGGIAAKLPIAAYIDDFSSDQHYLGRPVVKTTDVPADALVVATQLGRPLSARRHLINAGLRQIDYFSFHRYSGLALDPVQFWSDFRAEFDAHQADYQAIYQRLSDQPSRDTFQRLLNFRLNADLRYMEGFTDRQSEQYFEDFLAFRADGEVFADVGCYDGYTSAEFIRHCPGYQAVLIFEPEPDNMRSVQARLAKHTNIRYIDKGLSDRPQTLRFSSGGSSSAINPDGELEIQVDRLDQLTDQPITFLKMDIEGSEAAAIAGARDTIIRNRPRLALSVYHNSADLRELTQQVLAMVPDYKLYLRHYTEGVPETVMFFIP